VLWVLLFFFEPSCVTVLIVCYLLAEIFLNAGNVVILGREWFNKGVRNIERSIVLNFLALISTVGGFGALYRFSVGLSAEEAAYAAVSVLGTMGWPLQHKSGPPLLIGVQVFGDLFLLVVGVGLFANQLKLEETSPTKY